MSGHESDNCSSFDEEDDQDWGDWVDEAESHGLTIGSSSWQTFNQKTVYHALFLDEESHLEKEPKLKAFDSSTEALAHTDSLGCNLLEVISRCKLDPLQIIRLFNHLRRQTLDLQSTRKQISPSEVNSLKGTESFLNDDNELLPVPGYEEDGLLQVDFDQLLQDMGRTGPEDRSQESQSKMAELQSRLQATELAFKDLRQKYLQKSGISLEEDLREMDISNRNQKGKALASSAVITSGEDNHYFTSYASHDIHHVMISDKVRTLSYAKFLMSPHNSHLIRGKTIMDVGCGSGILSLFAARAGAKEVIAIDASDVANRARENIRVNGMEGIITVYKGRVEELEDQLNRFKGKVDMIVSEWMGYFLLYESMLPSVLYARDLYLQKGGLLAPSHTRMLLAGVANCTVISDRLQFWDNVHGFSMQAMKVGLVDEAWTDIFTPNQVISSIETIFELPLQTMTAKQPSFDSPFSLEIKESCSLQAFVSWFDTWFTPDGLPIPQTGRGDMQGGEKLHGLVDVELKCPKDEDVRGLNLEKGAIINRSTDVGDGKGEIVSFTTGPHGLETHWKQTLFVLKEPIEVEKGEIKLRM